MCQYNLLSIKLIMLNNVAAFFFCFVYLSAVSAYTVSKYRPFSKHFNYIYCKGGTIPPPQIPTPTPRTHIQTHNRSHVRVKPIASACYWLLQHVTSDWKRWKERWEEEKREQCWFFSAWLLSCFIYVFLSLYRGVIRISKSALGCMRP